MKKLSVFLAILLALSLLAGCATPSQPSASSETANTETNAPASNESDEANTEAENNADNTPVNLTMWTFLDVQNPTNSRAKALAQLIENFETANPGITVTVESQDHSTLPAKYYAAFQAGNAPDIVQVSVSNLSAGIEMGAFSTLESLFYNDWTDEEKADVACDMWEFGANEKGHYQVALFGGVYGILYRADYFEMCLSA